MRIGDFWQARAAHIHRWPAPEPEEKKEEAGDAETPEERHTFSGGHMLRMMRRMARALARLGARAGDAVCIPPIATPEHLALWMAALATGTRPVIAEAPEAPLPEDVSLFVTLPAHKAAFTPLARERGARLATLGGPWQGSFFMLQMVQPETAAPGEAAEVERLPATLFPAAETSFSELLERADTFRTRHAAALDAVPALLYAMPPAAHPEALATLLAALLEDRPLYWLTPGEEKRGWKQATELPAGTLALVPSGAVAPARATGRLTLLELPPAG